MQHERKGRVWQCVGSEPYTRKDGTATELRLWQAPCARCGALFTVKTPAATPPEQSKAFELLHCEMHRLSKAEVQVRWRDAMSARLKGQKNAD